ncbi:MAG: hypothetical protein CMI02_02330 [Oceanospirillaceae bacterium]|nr:hypothetical protein [Oceanospirillaceae bacterium]MBT10859.1 hypothetical protein [Oceanospirillaceae bacterium]|tara:strand:- start:121255 stop:121653 length:399 start_codon:yes stop_codon:yes gene_type:complete
MANKIMIADDSLFARMLAKEAVSKIMPDAEFLEATSGQQVLDEARKENYGLDWYLLDMNMELPDGLNTARQLIEAGVAPNRIALVTGNRSHDLQDDASGIRITYIQKTINPADVDKFVDRLQAFFALTQTGA